MTPREFRQEQDFNYDYFIKLTKTGIVPNYANIELFAYKYHKHKLKNRVDLSDVSECDHMGTTIAWGMDADKCTKCDLTWGV